MKQILFALMLFGQSCGPHHKIDQIASYQIKGNMLYVGDQVWISFDGNKTFILNGGDIPTRMSPVKANK